MRWKGMLVSVKRQVAIVIGVFLALWIVIPGLYTFIRAFVSDQDFSPRDDSFVIASIGLSFIWLLLGIIYLTIGAAIRHNSRRD